MEGMFLPRDRDAMMADLKDILYRHVKWQMETRADVESSSVDPTGVAKAILDDEISFLVGLLDMIERS